MSATVPTSVYGGCDCGAPGCTLPEGRCCLCGNPYVGRFSESGVCPACVPGVRAVRDADLCMMTAQQRADACDEVCPGWDVFNADEPEGAEIQACDHCNAGGGGDDGIVAHVAARFADMWRSRYRDQLARMPVRP